MNAIESALSVFLAEADASLSALERALEEESLALANARHDAPRVEALANAKREAATAVAGVWERYVRWLNDHGFSGDEGMERCLARVTREGGGGEALRRGWLDLLARAKHCRALNESNGAQITLLRAHVQRALNVLIGRGADATITYGRNGENPAAVSLRASIRV
ncbi:MAG TPA: flagellar protein FlgN [Methylococcaceae bacterium]|nr:flagellar protein FlgN [Methylococcaceae bacterium]